MQAIKYYFNKQYVTKVLKKLEIKTKGGQQSPVLRTGGAVKRPPMDRLTSN